MKNKIRVSYHYRAGKWECILRTPNGRTAAGTGSTKAAAFRAAEVALYGPAGRVPCALPAAVRIIK